MSLTGTTLTLLCALVPSARWLSAPRFKLKDADHAVDGRIYDPESGKTYKSVLSSDGNTLSVRGYVGIKAFGRSQTWKRTAAEYATCVGTTHR